jgi:hypothetical protein
MGGRVRANFGPTWLREPIYRGPAFRPMSELQELLLKKEEMDPQQQLQILQQQVSPSIWSWSKGGLYIRHAQKIKSETYTYPLS